MYYLLSITLLSLICSCSEPNLFKDGREWTYTVKRSNGEVTETVKMNIFKDSTTGDLFNRWVYIQNKNDSFPTTYSTERKINTIGNIESFGIHTFDLSPPNLNTIPSSVFFPNLYFRIPIEEGIIVDKKYDFQIKDENGKRKQLEFQVKNLGSYFYNNPNVNDYCWKLNTKYWGEQISLDADSYFHEKIGFVYIRYNLNNHSITLELSDINFEIEN